jgi:hypothetical protein
MSSEKRQRTYSQTVSRLLLYAVLVTLKKVYHRLSWISTHRLNASHCDFNLLSRVGTESCPGRVLELVAYHGAVANVLWAVGDGGWGEDGDGGAEGLHA